MTGKTTASWILITGMALSSCTSMSSSERPSYTGIDSVTTASETQLIGIWSVRELNPFPQTEPQKVTIEYRKDGTVHSIVIPQGESAEALGGMQLEINGQWRLEGDTLIHQNIELQTRGGNEMSRLLGPLISNRQADIAGQANIYELSTNRIVMVGKDGLANEYLRQ